MSPTPMVSIIVPVWNGEKTLRACVQSILEQTLTDLEIILVDDGSQDGTWPLMETLAAEEGRIRPFRQANAGVSQARNTGLQAARGRYIRFVDADDRLLPDSMRLLVERADRDEADMVLAAYYEDLAGQKTLRDLGRCEDTVDNAEFLRRLEPLSNSFYYGVLWNKLFRRDIIFQHHLAFTPGLAWGEDFVFVMGYLAYAERLAYTQTPVYIYIRNIKGAVARQFLRCFTHPIASMKDRLLVYRSYAGLYRARGAYPQYRHVLWRYMFRFTLNN